MKNLSPPMRAKRSNSQAKRSNLFLLRVKRSNLFILLLLPLPMFAQKKPDEQLLQKLMEKVTEYRSSEESDFLDLQDRLSYYLENPLSLNRASSEELMHIPVLNPEEVSAIIRHRTTHGDFLCIYELQIVEGLDPEKAQLLGYFLSVDAVKNTSVHQGDHELLLLTAKELTPRKGFSEQGSFQGENLRRLIRYRYFKTGKFSLGFTGENDAGEKFFQEKKSAGTLFDFQSYHLYLASLWKLKDLQLGDFQASFGQGLTMGTGLGLGKSAAVLSIAKNFNGFRTYRGGESGFLRGIAFTLRSGKFSFSPFYSRKKWDANTDTSETGTQFSSLNLIGYHRTPTEIENKHTLTRITTGGHLVYRSKYFNCGTTLVYEQFDPPKQSTGKLYNQFHFAGDHYFKGGVDYIFNIRNLRFFGETALSDNMATGTVNGLLASLARKVDVVLLHRYYDKKFNALLSNAFSENTAAQNEKGTYAGVILKPLRGITTSMYADVHAFPWLRFQADAPGMGKEYLVDIQYAHGKTFQCYFRYRSGEKAKNIPGELYATNKPFPMRLENYRLHADFKASDRFDFSTRLEYSNFYSENNAERGYLLYQDISWTSASLRKTRIAARWTVFDAQDYDARLYAYEQDVLYSFSIRQFYHTGTRFYLLWNGSLNRHLDFWIRYAITRYTKPVTSGSGPDLVSGDERSDLKIQLRLKF